MKKLFTILLACCTFLFSCEENKVDVDASLQDQQKVEVVNGRVKFKDEAVFNDYVSRLRNLDENERNVELQKLKGFISMYDKFSNLSDEEKTAIANKGGSDVVYLKQSEGEDGIEAFPQLNDNVLNKLVNGEGILLIGEKAVKHEWGKEITISPFSEEKLISYNEGQYNIDGVTVSNSIRSNLRGISSALTNYDSRHNYINSGLRLKVYFDYKGGVDGSWTEIEISSKLQDRIAGIWWPKNAENITVKGEMTGSYYFSSSPITLPGTGSANNDNIACLIANNNFSWDSWFYVKSQPVTFRVFGTCRYNGTTYNQEVFRQ